MRVFCIIVVPEMGRVVRGGRLLPEAPVVPLEHVAPRLRRCHVVVVSLAVVLVSHLNDVENVLICLNNYLIG